MNILNVKCVDELNDFLVHLDSDEHYRNRMKKRVNQKVKELLPNWKEEEKKITDFKVGTSKETIGTSEFVQLTACYCAACLEVEGLASDEVFSILLKAVEEMELEYSGLEAEYGHMAKFYHMVKELDWYLVEGIANTEIYRLLVDKISRLKKIVGVRLAEQFGDLDYWQEDEEEAFIKKEELIGKLGYFRNFFGEKCYSPYDNYWNYQLDVNSN